MATGYRPEDFLIADDLMLVLLDDEKGTTVGSSTAPYLLAGALLSELALLQRIAPEEKKSLFGRRKLLALGPGPLSDPLLQEAYDEVATRPQDGRTVVTKLSKNLLERLPERLVHRGLLRREDKKVMLIFTQARYLPVDRSRERTVRNEIRGALADGLTARPRVAALIALLSAGGSLKQVLREQDVPWSPDVRRRAKEIQQGDWGAGVVSAAIAASVSTIAGDAGSAGSYGGGDSSDGSGSDGGGSDGGGGGGGGGD